MKIGIVGYQGSGKSTLFEWLTEVAPDPAKSHQDQTAMAPVPDDRVEPLCEIYQPKKVTLAALELVDTPGLSRDHEGNAARLGLIREASCLIVVAAAFDGSDPRADLARFEEDLLLGDLDIVTRRVEKLRESVKKPRPSRDQEIVELEALEPLLALLEAGTSLNTIEMSEEQMRATRSFRLLTEKSRLNIVNVADDVEDFEAAVKQLEEFQPIVAVPIGLELELARMSREERDEMVKEMGLALYDRSGLLQKIMDASQQMIYFTAGEQEVRTWMLRQGGTALDAAGNIHTDLARGFIRAEVMQCEDLFRLGSEREIKANNLMRQEFKEYVVQDGDILHIKSGI